MIMLYQTAVMVLSLMPSLLTRKETFSTSKVGNIFTSFSDGVIFFIYYLLGPGVVLCVSPYLNPIQA